jgi:surface antigen
LKRKKEKRMKPMAIPVKLDARKMARRLPKLAFLLAISGSLATACSAVAQAQMINPFGVNNGQSLTKDDYKLANGAVAKLLNEASSEVGSYEDWSNPASGNHGKFTVLDIFTSKGMPCRKVKSSIVFSKAGAGPRSYTLDACKLPTGEWKTVA